MRSPTSLHFPVGRFGVFGGWIWIVFFDSPVKKCSTYLNIGVILLVYQYKLEVLIFCCMPSGAIPPQWWVVEVNSGPFCYNFDLYGRWIGSMVRSIFLYHINKFHCGNALYSYHMSLILFGLTVGIMTPPLWYTIIKQMFYKENHHTLSYLNSSPYVVHEGIKLANRYTGLWELCVCVNACLYSLGPALCVLGQRRPRL